MPLMLTMVPVTAPRLLGPPEAHAGTVVAPVDRGIQPPTDTPPLVKVPMLRERETVGLGPIPPLHALEQKMQPALQPPEEEEVLLHAVGQSAGSAYIHVPEAGKGMSPAPVVAW